MLEMVRRSGRCFWVHLPNDFEGSYGRGNLSGIKSDSEDCLFIAPKRASDDSDFGNWWWSPDREPGALGNPARAWGSSLRCRRMSTQLNLQSSVRPLARTLRGWSGDSLSLSAIWKSRNSSRSAASVGSPLGANRARKGPPVVSIG